MYEAGEVHSGSNGVWTTGRICDHSHEYTGSVDTLCQLNSLPAMSMVLLVDNRSNCFSEYEIDENHIPIYDTLTNDSHISAMMAIESSHTTSATLCHIVFSPCTVGASKNWSTPLSKVGITDRNCPYTNKIKAT